MYYVRVEEVYFNNFEDRSNNPPTAKVEPKELLGFGERSSLKTCDLGVFYLHLPP